MKITLMLKLIDVGHSSCNCVYNGESCYVVCCCFILVFLYVVKMELCYFDLLLCGLNTEVYFNMAHCLKMYLYD